jgi:DNA polymerase-1
LPKTRWIGAAEVNGKFGVEPAKVIEVMGLMGDAVDNIPGGKGIGEKTAIGLIRRFGTLENLFSRLDEIEPGAVRRRAAAENAGGWQRSGISQPGSGHRQSQCADQYFPRTA